MIRYAIRYISQHPLIGRRQLRDGAGKELGWNAHFLVVVALMCHRFFNLGCRRHHVNSSGVSLRSRLKYDVRTQPK